MTRPPAQAGSQDLILRRPGDEGEVPGTDRDLLRIDEPETRRRRYAGEAGNPEQGQILLERLGAADHRLKAEGAGVVDVVEDFDHPADRPECGGEKVDPAPPVRDAQRVSSILTSGFTASAGSRIAEARVRAFFVFRRTAPRSSMISSSP